MTAIRDANRLRPAPLPLGGGVHRRARPPHRLRLRQRDRPELRRGHGIRRASQLLPGRVRATAVALGVAIFLSPLRHPGHQESCLGASVRRRLAGDDGRRLDRVPGPREPRDAARGPSARRPVADALVDRPRGPRCLGTRLRGDRSDRDRADGPAARPVRGGPHVVIRRPRRDGRLRRGVPARRMGDDLLHGDARGTDGDHRRSATAPDLEAGVGTGFWLGRLPALVADSVGRGAPWLRPVGRDGRGGEAAPGGRRDRRRAGRRRHPRRRCVRVPARDRHDVVFAYDVVQQLPRRSAGWRRQASCIGTWRTAAGW